MKKGEKGWKGKLRAAWRKCRWGGKKKRVGGGLKMRGDLAFMAKRGRRGWCIRIRMRGGKRGLWS